MGKFTDLLHAVFGSDSGSDSQTGYLYVPSSEQGPSKDASPGRLIQNIERLRPWLVVNHHSLTTDRARQLAGKSAFAVDEDGDEYLVGHWTQANSALLHAAMALGARDYVRDEDRSVLLKPWRALDAVG